MDIHFVLTLTLFFLFLKYLGNTRSKLRRDNLLTQHVIFYHRFSSILLNRFTEIDDFTDIELLWFDAFALYTTTNELKCDKSAGIWKSICVCAKYTRSSRIKLCSGPKVSVSPYFNFDQFQVKRSSVIAQFMDVIQLNSNVYRIYGSLNGQCSSFLSCDITCDEFLFNHRISIEFQSTRRKINFNHVKFTVLHYTCISCCRYILWCWAFFFYISFGFSMQMYVLWIVPVIFQS